ncbi:anti-sigma28 factor (negative regulator of flagellin synthesis) [Sedimentibacter acidaminivorans]|uniref:Anti-sigma28 factor (Negative regulator of flagellin synthesis) n=1 Tax=Sedimentibacter acidaminivorans TaxID=913099 RepID=A0ABS4GDI3_9FIRM|nr:flagellar biosynthesis anti-sigma factor FlgM [Sedimentibacter acidaminivorans]MBP1925765.1 anti-sigma28 factor (negative regulator of flagellin synthesis) [Sedimentibacter acidaminivorans]
MKIQNINNYINYNGNKKPIKHEEVAKNKNYDVIEINKNNINKDAEKSEINYDNIKNNIVSEVKKEASSEKIDMLKESIKNKTYQIDVDEIVRILLDK